MRKYKLQFANVYTHEILREHIYNTPEYIHNIIKTLEATNSVNEDSFLFDSKRRTLRVRYVTRSEFTEDNDTKVYRLFFKVRLHDVQVPIVKSK